MGKYTGLAKGVFWAGCIGLVACGDHGGGSDMESIPQGSAQLMLGRNTVPFFDSLVLDVEGEGMEKRTQAFTQEQEGVLLEEIPPGDARRFSARVYADQGKLVQSGEVVAAVPTGERISLSLSLQAEAGFLELSVPLGLDNALGIASGSMELSAADGSHSLYPMSLGTGQGSFMSGALPLDKDFSLAVNLVGGKGEVLYTGSRTVRLSSLVQREVLELRSTRGSVALKLILSSLEPAQIWAKLPGSLARKASLPQDLVFTEVLAWPKTGGDDFEYLELYNATLDTLDVGGCLIGKTRASTGATVSFALNEGLRVSPMSYLLLGRDSVAQAQMRYQNFVLSNNGQSLVLHCEGNLVDSLYYGLPGDSLHPFPLQMGKALQLPLGNWKARASGNSWCAGGDSVHIGSLGILGSPGKEASCVP